jgi:electron transfer flavoprotein alpha subunit
MSDQKGSVWVIAEQVRGHIPDVSLELTGRARILADELGVSVEVVFLGNGTSDQAELLFRSGADVVYLGDSPDFAPYQPEIYTHSIVSLAKEMQPQIILIGSTFIGRELAPLIAAKLGTGLTAHCIDLVLDEKGVLEQRIPAYGGMMSIVCPEKRPQIATIARGVFPTPELDENRSGKIVLVETPKGIHIRVKTLEVVHKEPEGVSLESAPIVVAGGAGAGGIEGWQEIEALAEVLNAALGSTRPAVDEGWIELDTMIGQSGKMVSPEIYIGVGLSGELQHMVGIVGAKLMIAINNNAKAPVFEQVDYGVVEDCRVFVPALVKALKVNQAYIGRAAHVD